jgi:CheY-like chemotaxis protein/HPt (histidine-containing phosphotransfer) domain-containing protein
MRILVAEDSTESRELLIELLRHGGHMVAGVSNGREALDALEKNAYEVVFMDEEMPLFNGLDTTRVIRRTKYGHRMRPIIIGMSGNTAESDERRCLDAGMDAFMPKPIRMPEVLAMLAVLARRPVETGPASEPAHVDLEPCADLAARLERATGGNKNLRRSLVSNLLADAPKRLSALRLALEKDDGEGLASAAHALKGALGLFGADRAVSAACNLQLIGRSGQLDGADHELRALEEEFRDLQRKLAALEPTLNPERAGKAEKPRPQPASRPTTKPRR